MKKTSFFVLPLIALILGSCATTTTITGGDIPKLTENPGHLLKVEVSGSASGDSELLSETSLTKMEVKATYEVYKNYVYYYNMMNIDGEKHEGTGHHISKDLKYYLLTETDGKKEKIERDDPLGTEFALGAMGISLSANFYIKMANIYYEIMANFKETDKEAPNGEKQNITQSGDVYTLTTSREMNGIKFVETTKLTIKNDYFTAYESSIKLTKGNKKATSTQKTKFVFVAVIPSYSESKMPNPENYV